MAIDTKVVWNGDKKKKDINNGTIKALIRSVNLVDSKAKLLAPVDTGNLRASISKTVLNNLLEATVSTNASYASYVEFGLRSNSNYPKQPFMRPALNENKDNILKIFIDEETKAVDK